MRVLPGNVRFCAEPGTIGPVNPRRDPYSQRMLQQKVNDICPPPPTTPSATSEEIRCAQRAKEGFHTVYLRKCHGLWSATDHSQGLQLSVTETTQMHAGIRHGFMQSAEAFLPVFCLLFLLQTLKLHDLPRMLLSVVRRHIRWQ